MVLHSTIEKVESPVIVFQVEHAEIVLELPFSPMTFRGSIQPWAEESLTRSK